MAFDAAPIVTVDDMAGGSHFAGYDDSALSSPAFRVLRATVSTWVRDVSLHNNKFADQQMIHFYRYYIKVLKNYVTMVFSRWLRSPNALLYDPALPRTLHNLMKKLFIQLIAEFRRLGSTVVFADFSKVLLCSRKLSVRDALDYVEYILASVRNKELFHSIHIETTQCWEYLLWLDPVSQFYNEISKYLKNFFKANNGGVRGMLPTPENEISTPDEEVSSV